jgi:hypothetical protein
MKDFLHTLVDSLREELKEYGEMLVLLDQQQEMVMRRQTQDLLQCVEAINTQVENITAARMEREQRQRNVARLVGLADDAPFTVLVPLLPGEYRPLIQALVQENNELLKRIQRRARQNHLLLSRIVELRPTAIPGSSPASRCRNIRSTKPSAEPLKPRMNTDEKLPDAECRMEFRRSLRHWSIVIRHC